MKLVQKPGKYWEIRRKTVKPWWSGKPEIGYACDCFYYYPWFFLGFAKGTVDYLK